MGHLRDALSRAYRVLGFDAATDADEVFRVLVVARIIEPTSRLDSLRMLEEAGIDPPSYPTMTRRLPAFATDRWRQRWRRRARRMPSWVRPAWCSTT